MDEGSRKIDDPKFQARKRPGQRHFYRGICPGVAPPLLLLRIATKQSITIKFNPNGVVNLQRAYLLTRMK
jgi:hypothetical protein